MKQILIINMNLRDSKLKKSIHNKINKLNRTNMIIENKNQNKYKDKFIKIYLIIL